MAQPNEMTIGKVETMHPLLRLEARNLERDRRFVKKTNESMDTVMVFAGLFSAAIAQFIASTSNDLKADSNQLTNQLLNASFTLQRHPDATIAAFSDPDDFQASGTAIAINALFFFSLVLSLLSALEAMIVKQWVGRYETHGAAESLLHKRTRLRAEARLNMESWRLKQAIVCVPYTLHVALAIFLSGLLLWVFTLNTRVMIPSLILVGIAAVAYFCLGMISLLFDNEKGSPKRRNFRLKSYRSVRARKELDIEKAMERNGTGVENSARVDLPPITFILNPPIDPKPDADPLRPVIPDVSDAIVWINAIKDTRKHDELIEAFHELRMVDWGQLDLNGILFKNGDIILSRCSDVASAQWKKVGSTAFLCKGAKARVHKLCLFIEWLYHQLSVEQRRSLKCWPDSGIAKAFVYDPYDGEPPDDMPTAKFPTLEEITLGNSVIAKLHHVQLAPGEVCDMCITEECRSSMKDVRVRIPAAQDPRVYGEYARTIERFPWCIRMQKLVTACISSDADCLLNYTSGLSDQELEKRMKGSYQTLLRCVTAHIGPLGPGASYKALLELLDSLRTTLGPTDLRVKWFDEVTRYARWEYQSEADTVEDDANETAND